MDRAPSHLATEIVRFGSFCLMPADRRLLDDGKPVHLGNRAFDILLLLVERAGEFVGNDDIVKRVWPTTVVAQGNLRVHLAGLRKALGDGRGGQRFIVNVPNRGYSFVREVVRDQLRGEPQAERPAPAEPSAAMQAQMPTPLNRVIGQEQALQAVLAQLRRHRLVTLVGAGGIGKTTIALTATGTMALASSPGWSGVHFIDLAPLADAQLVPNALAAALGLSAVLGDPVRNLLAYLHDKSLLILFDNCEHLIAATAALVEEILRGAPRVHVLATSREPLRASGEWVQRVQALDLPPSSTGLAARQALAFSAVELFVERASAALDTFTLTDADVPALVHICRRLDGIPLAIELAAARVDPLGLRGVAAAVDDCFALLSKGRRTALPRHQTLRATLDWSFGLLSEREQTVLLRLSVFAGPFSLEAATAVAAWGVLEAGGILDDLSDLVAKSLLTADVSGEEVMFRLLDTTRTYSAQRLQAQQGTAEMRLRHARYCLRLLEQADASWPSTPPAAWLQRYGRCIGDVRSALQWAFGADGDPALGATLTARAAPLFFQFSFVDELYQHAESALAALAILAVSGQSEARLDFELSIVYANALFHTRGLQPESTASFERALSIARQLGDSRSLALAYSTNWMGAYNRGQPRQMLEFARQFEAHTASETDEALKMLHDRMFAPSLHFDGDQRGARACAERGLAVKRAVRAPFLSGSQIDRRVSLGTILARVLWVQGLVVQAEDAIAETLQVAAQDGESVALAFGLAFCACPLAIASGRLDLARTRVDALVRHAREHSLSAWLRWGLAYDALVRWQEEGAGGTPPPADLAEPPWQPQLVELMAVLHPAYADQTALARAEAGDAGWCAPEVRRVHAERLRADEPAGGTRLLRQALAQAQRDGALAWELRIATSLADAMAHAGSQARGAKDATLLLEEVLGRVTEGFSTPDVQRAVAAYRTAARSQGRKTLRPFPDA